MGKYDIEVSPIEEGKEDLFIDMNTQQSQHHGLINPNEENNEVKQMVSRGPKKISLKQSHLKP